MKSVSLFSVSFFAFILLAFTPAATTTWKADSGHSHLGFVVRHMGLIDFHGSFRSFDATITHTKPDFSDATVELSGEVSSINTGNEGRDKHLASADFFDAEKFPQFTFRSTSFKKTGENEFSVTGPMSFHGITKDITLKVINTGNAENPYDKKQLTGFKITGTFNRLDFNISKDTPNLVLGEEISLVADIIFAAE